MFIYESIGLCSNKGSLGLTFILYNNQFLAFQIYSLYRKCPNLSFLQVINSVYFQNLTQKLILILWIPYQKKFLQVYGDSTMDPPECDIQTEGKCARNTVSHQRGGDGGLGKTGYGE